MFGFLTSEQKRARHDAHNWLHLARKVYHFRRDQLPVKEVEGLQQAMYELRTRLKERADAAKLKMGMERLEGCLRQSGGAYYPKSSLVDNVEFFLVALILFLGIRAFIIQPFKIPTNSMWPTYNGLTAEAYADADQIAAGRSNKAAGTITLVPAAQEPNKVAEAARLVLYGASPRRVDAPVSGEIYVAMANGDGRGFAAEIVPARKWFVFPDQAVRYKLFVGSTPVDATVPTDFRFDLLMQKLFFPDEDQLRVAIRDAENLRHYAEVTVTYRGQPHRETAVLVATGHHVQRGDRVLSFDVMTGDQLFVDRVSYNFVRPSVGDGFVFRTLHIPNIEPGREFSDKYYIKRLVGVPGDKIEIHPPVVYRNGKPITGAAAFEKNAHEVGMFPGYTAGPTNPQYFMHPGETITVPPHRFFAMGDNSPDSADSRYWGFVPAPDVVGRPLFIYYPFTRRWGPAR